MQLTESEKQKIQEEFAARRKRQLLVTIPAIAVVFLLALLGNRVRGAVLGILILVGVGGRRVFSFRNWRCPACDGYLGRSMGARFCSKCGVQLRS